MRDPLGAWLVLSTGVVMAVVVWILETRRMKREAKFWEAVRKRFNVKDES